MSFGTLAIPTGGTQNMTLSPMNSTLSGTGTQLYGAPSRGIYSLKSSGSGGVSITIDINSVATNSAALTLDSFTGVYNGSSISSFPSGVLALPSTSGTSLYLGATETVTSAMTPSEPDPTFDIVVTIN